MSIKTWSNSPASQSLFFGLFKLLMNESRLKNNASFESSMTIQGQQRNSRKPFTPSVSTEKSVTIIPGNSNQREFKDRLKSIKIFMWALFLKYWFLLGLLVAIVLAVKFPDVARKGGYIRAEWTIKWGKKTCFS